MARIKWEDRQYNVYFTIPGVGGGPRWGPVKYPEGVQHISPGLQTPGYGTGQTTKKRTPTAFNISARGN